MTIKLTREEVIQDLKAIKSFERYARGRLALDVAIEALEGVCFDEWCTDCKEYDTEKNCCPRFNRVIREAMKRIPNEDGTLEVKVDDATKIGRVLISDDKHRGGLYYPDEYEPKGEDLISRAEAIEAMGEEPPVWCDDDAEIAERSQWRDDIEAIKSVPSADRPRGYWIGDKCSVCGEERAWYGSNPPICPDCGAKMEHNHDYERASDMCDYCERYEPTYNSEDGSMQKDGGGA